MKKIAFRVIRMNKYKRNGPKEEKRIVSSRLHIDHSVDDGGLFVHFVQEIWNEQSSPV